MKKNICFLLLGACLVILALEVKSTYAKYLTTAEGKGNIAIARWKILVNNEDIRDNKNIENEITPVFPGTEHINENVIAPTSIGYFDLVIDATEADVSFKYKIDISPNEESSVKDLKIIKYVIDDIETEITNESFSIENTVLHKDNNKIINLRVYIHWDDSENATMNNTEDTNATLTNNAKLNVKLHFTQLTN